MFTKQIKGLEGYKAQYEFQRKMRLWETRCMSCEREFLKLQQQTDYTSKVEPCFYNLLLVAAMICLIISADLLIREVANVTVSNREQLEKLPINLAMRTMYDNNQFSLCNVLFTATCLYQLYCYFCGNSFLGFRFASPLFYPMKENETLLGSFMYNIAM